MTATDLIERVARRGAFRRRFRIHPRELERWLLRERLAVIHVGHRLRPTPLGRQLGGSIDKLDR